MMKEKNWPVGVPFILTLSCVVSFPFFLRRATDSSFVVLYPILHIVLFSFSCWFLFQSLIRFTHKKLWYISCSAIIVILLGAGFDVIEALSGIDYSVVVGTEFTGYKQLLMKIFREMLLGGLVAFVVYYLEILKEKQRNAIELEQLKQKQLEANISSLKEQLSPHFLFNSLNTLKSLIRQDPEASEDFVVKLSEVYRFLLMHWEDQTVSITEELGFIKAYSYLLKSRFGENFQVHIHIPEPQQKNLIPPLTLQLLIENAVKHNIVSRSNPLTISITSIKTHLIISNNFQPKNSIESSGNVGLSNINKRYLLLAGEGIQIQKQNSVFTVKIPMLHSL
ncbi:sensor histidine kinase [Sinomicrobium sp. M5D2P17]